MIILDLDLAKGRTECLFIKMHIDPICLSKLTYHREERITKYQSVWSLFTTKNTAV